MDTLRTVPSVSDQTTNPGFVGLGGRKNKLVCLVVECGDERFECLEVNVSEPFDTPTTQLCDTLDNQLAGVFNLTEFGVGEHKGLTEVLMRDFLLVFSGYFVEVEVDGRDSEGFHVS